MAAATSAIIGASVGILGAGKQMIDAEKQKSQAKRDLKAFQRQEFINPNEDIQVSTLQADQQTDANLSSTASSVDALRRGGTRAVLGGIPRVNESGILLQNMISQDLEKQDLARSYKIAQGEEDIRAMREQREQGALLGLGQQLQVGRQDSASGLTNLVSGGLALGSSINSIGKENTNTFTQEELYMQKAKADYDEAVKLGLIKY